MKKLINLSLSLILFLFSVASCSDDDNNGNTDSGQKQIEEVINKLELIPDVSEFTQALKDVGNINVSSDQLTVFAVKNQSNDKAVRLKSDSTLNTDVVKRHIVKGIYDLSKIGSDSLSIYSITNDLLIVLKKGNEILINGVPLVAPTPTKAGNSYIYIVPVIIPKKEDMPSITYSVDFRVREWNENWNVVNSEESFVSKNAMITIFKKTGTSYIAIDSIATDANGAANYRYTEKQDLYYKIKKGNKTIFYYGYKVTGIFKSQTDADAAPSYQTGMWLDNPKPGYYILADLNGDGIINAADKVASEYMPISNEEPIQEINIISQDTRLTIDWENAYKDISGILDRWITSLVTSSYSVDYRLVNPTPSYYPSISDRTAIGELWRACDEYIKKFLAGEKSFNDPECPQNIKNQWKQDASGKRGVEYCYAYSVMINYFGNVPLYANADERDIPRSYETEVIAHIIQKLEHLNSSDPAKAILARIYANERNYAKAKEMSLSVINSGKYSLVANNKPLDSASNVEVIMGGYAPAIKGKYMHPLRYREILLICAEANIELGNLQEAIMYINQIYMAGGLTPIGIASQATLRAVVRNLWNSEMSQEGLGYMLHKRWGTFESTFGPYGATNYNKLLPIPQTAFDTNSKMTQNPGY